MGRGRRRQKVEEAGGGVTRGLLRCTVVPMPVDILAIAAHRDDVELTCAGTLLKAVDAGYGAGLEMAGGEILRAVSEEYLLANQPSELERLRLQSVVGDG